MQVKTPDMVLPFAEYFGYFILDEYHRQHRLIEQVCSGGKFMQVTHDRICFINSLILPDAFVHVSKNLSHQRVEERIFPASLQYAPQSGVCGTYPRHEVLSARNHVGQWLQGL